MSGYKLAIKRPVLKTQHETHFSQVKLPYLDKKHSQQEAKQLTKIRSGKLPHLNPSHDNNHSSFSQLYERCSSEVAADLPYDIEQKINNILQRNPALNNDYYNDQSSNFQANILKNKELLKIQREKRQSVLSKLEEHYEYEPKVKEKPQKLNKNRKKQHCLSKKALSKLKFSAEDPPPKSRIEHITLREESKIFHSMDRGGKSSPGKKPVLNRLQQKVSEMKNKISKRTKEKNHKMHTEGQYEEPSENLFDNIHNYLSNPHRQSERKLTSSTSKIRERKQLLQQKLKDIECKLETDKQFKNEKQVEDNPKSKDCKAIDCEISEWRRINLKDPAGGRLSKQFSVHTSSFEHEINHLGHLQSRNEHSLERYVQNQRMLYSLKKARQSSSKQHLLKKQFLSK